MEWLGFIPLQQTASTDANINAERFTPNFAIYFTDRLLWFYAVKPKGMQT